MRQAWLAALLVGCSTPRDSEVWLIDTLTLEGQPKPGMASGFNLDGRVSDETDEASCGHADALGLDGTPGVDNQFAALLPAMELVAGEAVHALVQSAIDDGSLLITLELTPTDRRHHRLDVARAVGPALTGADGGLVAGQTLLPDPELPSSSVEGVDASRPKLLARGLTLDLPLTVLGYALEFTLEDAVVELYREDGEGTGRLSGLISLDQLDPTLDFINTNGDPQIAEPIRAAMEANADVDRDGDGECRYLSISVRYTAIPAWLFVD